MSTGSQKASADSTDGSKGSKGSSEAGVVASPSAGALSISLDGSWCEQVLAGSEASSSQQEEVEDSPPGHASSGPQPVHSFFCWQKVPQQQSAQATD